VPLWAHGVIFGEESRVKSCFSKSAELTGKTPFLRGAVVLALSQVTLSPPGQSYFFTIRPGGAQLFFMRAIAVGNLPAAYVRVTRSGTRSGDGSESDAQSDDGDGANPYIDDDDDDGDEEEEAGALAAAQEGNFDDASASDDSEEEVVVTAQGASRPTVRRWTRRRELGLPPLSRTQLNNFEAHFDDFSSLRDAEKKKPLTLRCAASFKSAGGKRVYGKITSIDGGSATLTVSKQHDVTEELSLPLGRFRRRVYRLSGETVAEWARAEVFLGGVPLLRAEYRHYVRSRRSQRRVSEWHDAVLQGLRDAPDAGGFNVERFREVAASAGLDSKEGARNVFAFLLQESKAIKRKNGKYPTYKVVPSSPTVV
jgi:hypothetical protein